MANKGRIQYKLDPGKLTFWTPKNGGGWKMILLFNWVIFSFHVNFQGCIKHSWLYQTILVPEVINLMTAARWPPLAIPELGRHQDYLEGLISYLRGFLLRTQPLVVDSQFRGRLISKAWSENLRRSTWRMVFDGVIRDGHQTSSRGSDTHDF